LFCIVLGTKVFARTVSSFGDIWDPYRSKEEHMQDWVMSFDRPLTTCLIPVGWKILGAIVMWVVGGWVINVIGRLQNPNVLQTPPPSVEILEFNLAGTLLAVRPFCHNNNDWQVYFDTNRAIQDVCSAAGYPAPSMRQVVLHKPMES
jgi:small-conductance mechanosensitive channel